MAFEDPLKKFYKEDEPPTAGTKDPVTGLRATNDTIDKAKLRTDEGKRKSEVAKRIITYLMNDEYGREWLYDMLTTCNVFGTPFAGDPVLTAYNSGALYIGRLIEGEMRKFSIREYALMLTEAWEREKVWNDLAADKN